MMNTDNKTMAPKAQRPGPERVSVTDAATAEEERPFIFQSQNCACPQAKRSIETESEPEAMKTARRHYIGRRSP